MKKAFLALCLCVSVALPAWATTVTGTVKDPGGVGITGTLQLELSAPGITGSELLLIQPRVSCAVAAGVIGACTVRGNDTITSPAGTYYCLRVLSSNGAKLTPKGLAYTVAGAAFDVGTATQAGGKTCKE